MTNAASERELAEPVPAGPVKQRNRIITLDVLRGFALLGILLMNIQSFSMIDAAYLNPTANASLDGANRWVWYFCSLLVDLKFMGLFSILFGAGIGLMADKSIRQNSSATALHYRRMFTLLLIGLAHAYLIWSGDILVMYSICGSFVYLVARLSARWLLALGSLSLLIGLSIWTLLGLAILIAPESEMAELRESDWQPTPELVQEELAVFRGSWREQQQRRTVSTFQMHLIGLPIMFWRTCGMMLIGMAMFRVGVLSGDRSNITYVSMAAVGFVIGFPIIAWGIHWNISNDWSMRTSLFLGTLPNQIGSIFVSLGYIGMIILLLRSRVGDFMQATLAPVGRMALTNYLGQSVICTFLFYGHGFGWIGTVDRVGQLLIVLCVWAFQIISSMLWMAKFRFGPMEYCWRKMTYGKAFG